MTGSSVPGQKGAETQVLIGVDSAEEGVAESTVPPKTKTAPETMSPEDSGSIVPEQTASVGMAEVATVEEANIESQAETTVAERNIKGLPSEESGATGNLKWDVF